MYHDMILEFFRFHHHRKDQKEEKDTLKEFCQGIKRLLRVVLMLQLSAKNKYKTFIQNKYDHVSELEEKAY